MDIEGDSFLEDLQAFSPGVEIDLDADSGDSPPGRAKLVANPEPDWFDPYPHDRYFVGGTADRQRNGIGDRNDHVGVAANDLASEIGKPLGMPLAGYRSAVRVCPSTLPRRRSSSKNARQLRSPASLISVTEPRRAEHCYSMPARPLLCLRAPRGGREQQANR